MGANTVFHGRKHFMGANISWAQTFHGREYFMGSNILMYAKILCVNYYCRRAPIFYDFAVSSASSIFAISFD